MAAPTGRGLLAGFLSMLVPGAGQLYAGARRRGLVLLGLTGAALLGLLALTSWLAADHLWGVDRRLVAAVLAVDLALLGLRLFAVVDASRGGWAVGLAVLVALTAAPHVAAAWVTVRSYDVLDSVFADEEPCGTACDRGSVLLAHVVRPLPEWVPKDAWEWALVERLGPGEVAPLEADARVVADAKPADVEAVDDDPAARHRRGPGQLGRPDGHDHPRGRPARHRPGRRLRRAPQPRPGAARPEGDAVQGADQRALRAARAAARPGRGT